MSNRTEQPSWYLEKRREILGVFDSSQADEAVSHLSPSGRYRLEVTPFSTGPNTWSYSRGVVFSGEKVIAQIDRNFNPFPFSWCEDHPNGHSYLICGEDYQCQTIIELDTQKRLDHVDPAAEQGSAFCWAAHFPSPDGKFLFVDGCHWACPYELVLFDFSAPMNLPYPELGRWPVWETQGFQDDGSFIFDYEKEARKEDGKLLEELSDQELDELDAAPDYDEVVELQKYRMVWRQGEPDLVTRIE